ncbi:unnamed protein product, partial [Scytosiphon promiscuus]
RAVVHRPRARVLPRSPQRREQGGVRGQRRIGCQPDGAVRARVRLGSGDSLGGNLSRANRCAHGKRVICIGHSEAVCDNGQFTEGSFRTMSSGWGIPGSTDVRTFGDVGTGRYTHTGFDWLLELTLYRVVALVAEASRVHHADEFIYEDAGWKASAQAAMTEGWNAILGAEYVESLERNLDVDLSALQENSQAFAVFEELCAQLVVRHSDGLWTSLFVDDVDTELIIASPNRNSWVSKESGRLRSTHRANIHVDFNPYLVVLTRPASTHTAAMESGVSPVEIREMLDLDGLPSSGYELELDQVVSLGINGTIQVSGGARCLDDAEDLVYLAQTYGMVEYLETFADGSVKAVGFYPASRDQEVDLRQCAVA